MLYGTMSKKPGYIYVPIGLVASFILLQSHFQERLPDKSAPDIIYSGRQFVALEFFLNLREGT